MTDMLHKPWTRMPQPGSPVWMVCGSSPLARVSMLQALEEFHPQVTITCNGGHRLFDVRTGIDHPTFYFLSDQEACRIYAVDSSFLQARYGTMVLTPSRERSAIRERGMEHADQFLAIDRKAPPGLHTPGKYAGQPLSGLWMLDIALNRGAETVLIVGYDGYRSHGGDRVVDYFDGRYGAAASLGHNPLMAAYLDSAVRARPKVRFVMFGQPVYETPEAENFRLVRPGERLEQAVGAL